jgi:xylan 1,4-beta-xylosidase
VRYDEVHHYEIELAIRSGRARVTGRACLPTLRQESHVDVPIGDTELVLEMHPVPTGFPEPGSDPQTVASRASCDRIHLVAIDADGIRHELATLDGRFLSSESACSFTGRVVGMYCESGTLDFLHYRERELG